MNQYLQATSIIDYSHVSVRKFTKEHIRHLTDPRKQAISLYYAVRDGIRYDPYSLDLTEEGLRASTTLENGRSWCVPKAVLLAACCRFLGIPARLGFADVRNHLSTARMREIMKTDVFQWHGYTSIYLDGAWVKATPAFNIELCRRFLLKPLDFDGRSDSLYHPCDEDGNRHMEYLRHRGEFPDVPIDRISESFGTKYSIPSTLEEADFDRDVERENILD